MTRLSDETIVRTWERAVDASSIERTLALLEVVSPDASRGALLDLPVGARDVSLVAALRATFGDTIDAYAACSACAAELEIPLDLRSLVPPAASSAEMVTSVDALEITFRLPSTRDVLSVVGLDADAATLALVRRCVIAATSPGGEVDPEALTPHAVDAIERAMEHVDAAADVELALTCPTCAHTFSLSFDPASFLWTLIKVRAKRLFDDVDHLARAYGWTEREILALGQRRRDIYLSKAVR